MAKKFDKEFTKLLLFNLMMLLFFGVMLLIGSYHDEGIAKVLYSPDNIPVKILTSTGVYPFFASAVFFSGVAYQRIYRLKIHKAVKVPCCAILILLATAVGFIGAGSIVDKDCLGSIFPVLNRNIPVIVGLSILTIFPLFYLGFRMADKVEDRLLLKRILILLVLLALSYIALTVFKNAFPRPRYRLAVQGYEGIGFRPWYTPLVGAADYVEKLAIDKGEFRSFPSGHSILSMSVIMILQSFSWLIPKWSNKRFILGLAGFLFAVMIMLSRMILGAHYLSDVSAGAIIGTVFSICFTFLQQREK